jgi:hypothetical protein
MRDGAVETEWVSAVQDVFRRAYGQQESLEGDDRALKRILLPRGIMLASLSRKVRGTGHSSQVTRVTISFLSSTVASGEQPQ